MKETYAEAAAFLVAGAARVGDDQWEEPGLGQWTVRQLAGHAGRALSTVQEYLRATCPDDLAPLPPGADDDPVGGAGESFLGTHDAPALHEGVAARGREAGEALGPAPAEALAVLATGVVQLVTEAPDTAVFVTRFGLQPFATYLATRVVELVVHTVDLCVACGLEPAIPAGAERVTLAVLAETGRRRGAGAEIIGALGGRAPLPAGFNLFG
jgi:uncharacterized protein (TIGR03083 family)